MLGFINSIYKAKFKYPTETYDSDKTMQDSWMLFLGPFDYVDVKIEVVSLMRSNPEWPPTAPMLANAVSTSKTDILDAAEECWNYVETKTRYRTRKLDYEMDEAGRIAFKRIGGFRAIENVDNKSWPFTKKEYLALYRDAANEIHQENIKRISNGDEPLAIGDYEQEYSLIDQKPTKPGSIGNLLDDVK